MIDVLIVDDDDSLRESLALGLSDQFLVRVAGSGEEALKVLAQKAPDVMVLDEQMPGISGTDLMAVLPSVGPPAVLVLSGRADVGLARRSMLLGAYDCLAKPFDLGDLRSRIVEAAAHTRWRKPRTPFGVAGMRRLQDALDKSGRGAGSLASQIRQVEWVLACEAMAEAAGDRRSAAQSLGLSELELDGLLALGKPA